MTKVRDKDITKLRSPFFQEDYMLYFLLVISEHKMLLIERFEYQQAKQMSRKRKENCSTTTKEIHDDW